MPKRERNEPYWLSARNLLESFGPSTKAGLLERSCLLLDCSCSMDEKLDEAGDARMDPTGEGFDEMVNPAGEETEEHCASCPSEPGELKGKAVLLAAACSSVWTSGEVLACKVEEEQASRGAAFLKDDPMLGPGVVTTVGEAASRTACALGPVLGKPL